MAYIRNPQSLNPRSRMPAQGRIQENDLRALATYLTTLK
jgi:hypothetical protein